MIIVYVSSERNTNDIINSVYHVVGTGTESDMQMMIYIIVNIIIVSISS